LSGMSQRVGAKSWYVLLIDSYGCHDGIGHVSFSSVHGISPTNPASLNGGVHGHGMASPNVLSRLLYLVATLREIASQGRKGKAFVGCVSVRFTGLLDRGVSGPLEVMLWWAVSFSGSTHRS